MAATWLLMSGLFKPMILAFGAFSVAFALFVARRTDAVDGCRVPIELKVFASIGYFFWLLVEIAKANWAVTKIILSPKMPIRQHLFRAPYTQRTDLAQTIYANSITLTPGTITVEIDDWDFLVHALNYGDGDPDALEDMDARVSRIEVPD